MTTMMALRAHLRGGLAVLVYEAAQRPEPGPGEVLIEVHAAGITFAELTWDRTWWRHEVERAPLIPSHEVSGVVVELGPGVSDFQVGDLVCGLIRFDYDGRPPSTSWRRPLIWQPSPSRSRTRPRLRFPWPR